MNHVIVISGPPCAGKSTYIDEHRGPRDLIVDMDRIAHALGYPTEQIDYDLEHPARSYALIARASILKRLPARDIPTTWIVSTTGGRIGPLEQHVELNPGQAVCHQRATHDNRPASTHQQIDQWYTEHGNTRQW